MLGLTQNFTWILGNKFRPSCLHGRPIINSSALSFTILCKNLVFFTQRLTCYGVLILKRSGILFVDIQISLANVHSCSCLGSCILSSSITVLTGEVHEILQVFPLLPLPFLTLLSTPLLLFSISFYSSFYSFSCSSSSFSTSSSFSSSSSTPSSILILLFMYVEVRN